MKTQKLPLGVINSQAVGISFRGTVLLFALIFLSALLDNSIKVSAQLIYTYAGNGTYGYTGDGGAATAAELNGNQGVAADAYGNLYIAEQNDIRKINPAGIITTIAGDGSTYTYSGEGGLATAATLAPYSLAVDGAGNLFIAVPSSFRILKIDMGTGIISTVAGDGTNGYSGDGGPAISAQIGGAYGIAVDNSGNLYISDEFHSIIRKVDAMGIISTYAGVPTIGIGGSGHSGDGGPATAAHFDITPYPNNIAVDASGNLYIATANDEVVRKIDASGIITTFAGNYTSGYTGDGGAATSAELREPLAVATDNCGNVFINHYEGTARKVDASGIITTIAGNGTWGYSGDGGPATAAEIYELDGLAADGNGNIYISDGVSDVVRQVTGTSDCSPSHSCIDYSWMTVTSTTNTAGNCVFTATANVSTVNSVIGYLWTGGTTETHRTHSRSNSYTLTVTAGSDAVVSVTAFVVDTNLRDSSSGPCCQAIMTHTVTCTSDGYGYASHPVTRVPQTQGLYANQNNAGVMVYPNPSENLVTVTSQDDIKTIDIISVNGKKMANYSYDGVKSANVSLGKLPPGTYLLRINNAMMKMISKIE